MTCTAARLEATSGTQVSRVGWLGPVSPAHPQAASLPDRAELSQA